LRKQGVRVSINTDDPALMGLDLVEEYAATAAAYEWSDDVVADVARTSLQASFQSA
jgi:adenosine deaminase